MSDTENQPEKVAAPPVTDKKPANTAEADLTKYKVRILEIAKQKRKKLI